MNFLESITERLIEKSPGSSVVSIDTTTINLNKATLTVSHTKGINYVLSLVLDEDVEKEELEDIISQLNVTLFQDNLKS